MASRSNIPPFTNVLSALTTTCMVDSGIASNASFALPRNLFDIALSTLSRAFNILSILSSSSISKSSIASIEERSSAVGPSSGADLGFLGAAFSAVLAGFISSARPSLEAHSGINPTFCSAKTVSSTFAVLFFSPLGP